MVPSGSGASLGEGRAWWRVGPITEGFCSRPTGKDRRTTMNNQLNTPDQMSRASHCVPPRGETFERGPASIGDGARLHGQVDATKWRRDARLKLIASRPLKVIALLATLAPALASGGCDGPPDHST